MTLIVVKANLVSSGRLDLNNDGEADLDIVESFMEDNNIDNKDIFDNDDWFDEIKRLARIYQMLRAFKGIKEEFIGQRNGFKRN